LDENDVDIIVVGGGSAGFMAGVRAAQLGGKVMVLEKERIGGICPIWGCIPMLFLFQCVEFLELMKEAKEYGFNIGEVNLDFARLMSVKKKVVERVVVSMEGGLKDNGVQIVIGSGKLVSPERVEIKETREIIRAKKIVVATGSVARRYEIPGAYGIGVITAKELLEMKEVPKSLAIIGRSTVALELATIWAKLGSAVTVIARRPEILPSEDVELTKYIVQALEEDGVRMYAGVDVERIDDCAEGKSITICGDGARQKVEVKFVIFALGQRPFVNGLGLENAGIAVTDGRIRTNERMETDVKGIYAAGDVTGEVMAANVALVQGAVAGENAMGRNSIMDYHLVPRATRTIPPMATVGITESEAKEKGLDIKVAKFSFEENPKACILRERVGFVKIVALAESGKILGVHILGPEANELIHEAVVIMKMGGTAQDLAATIHVHPCLHEAVWRSARSIASYMLPGTSTGPFIGHHDPTQWPKSNNPTPNRARIRNSTPNSWDKHKK